MWLPFFYMAEGGHTALADLIKSVHAELRQEYKQGKKSCDEIWSEHVRKDDLLQRYSHSMHMLATSVWSPRQELTDDGGDDRIAWCIAACKEYYLEGRLAKLLQKDLRRLEFGKETVAHPSVIPQDPHQFVLSTFPRPWPLLDVGSCYNPFADYSDLFTVTAVDIAPACKTVIKADFLNLTLMEDHPSDGNKPSPQKAPAAVFCRASFAVVVFSLLLSYFPAPLQRLRCCINAFHLLQIHGILVIITPDSSHQNKNMTFIKSWQLALESLGFSKWKYEKRRHLHCIAFRKCHERMLVSQEEAIRSLSPHMCILQDSQDMGGPCLSDVAISDKNFHCESDDTEPMPTTTTSTLCAFQQLPSDV